MVQTQSSTWSPLLPLATLSALALHNSSYRNVSADDPDRTYHRETCVVQSLGRTRWGSPVPRLLLELH